MGSHLLTMNGGHGGHPSDAEGLAQRWQRVAPAMRANRRSTQHGHMARSCLPTHPTAGEACSGFAVQRMPPIAADARCAGARRLGTHAAHVPWLRHLLGPGSGLASRSHPLGLWCGPGHCGAHVRQRTLGRAPSRRCSSAWSGWGWRPARCPARSSRSCWMPTLSARARSSKPQAPSWTEARAGGWNVPVHGQAFR